MDPQKSGQSYVTTIQEPELVNQCCWGSSIEQLLSLKVRSSEDPYHLPGCWIDLSLCQTDFQGSMFDLVLSRKSSAHS